MRVKGKLTDTQIKESNFILDLSDENIIEFEKIVNDIEERVYQLFNNGEIVDAKNTAIDNLIENFGGENFREEFTQKLSEYGDNPTKYNPKVENYRDIDALFNFLNIISYSPK
jgi:sulfite reductase beta subunit-like hemoprotein